MARPALRKANSISARQPVLAGALRGDSFRLGPEVGAGGEGIVYAIAHRPELLAKVFRRAPSPRDIDKLRALVCSGTPELLERRGLAARLSQVPLGCSRRFPHVAHSRCARHPRAL